MNLSPSLVLAAIGNPVSDRAWAIFLGCFLAAVALGLLILSWTRWGQSKLLTKCIAIALLAHIWLLLYAYGTRIPYGSPGQGTGDPSRQDASTVPSNPVMVAWTPNDSVLDPPSLQAAQDGPSDSIDPTSSVETPLWNRSLESPTDSAIDLPPPEVDNPTQISDEELRLLGQIQDDTPMNLPVDASLDDASLDAKNVSLMPTAAPMVPIEAIPMDIGPPKLSRSLEDVPPAYRLRFAPDRFAYAMQNGGDEDTEQAVRRALEFLAKSQSSDGNWSAQAFGAGQRSMDPGPKNANNEKASTEKAYTEEAYRADTGKFADTAMTGLALLAFLGAGHTHIDSGPYATTVKRGLVYLSEQQFPSGDLSGRNQIGNQPTVRYSRMYSHGIAGIALAEAYAMTQDKELLEPIRGAVGNTLKAMNPKTGGWRYDFASDDPGDTSQFGWQAMLLNSANASQASPLQGAHRVLLQRFLDSVATGKSGGLAVYRNLTPQVRPPSQQASAAMTAEALAIRSMLGLPMSAQATQEAKQMLLGQLPGKGQTNFYSWYYATLALYHTKNQPEAWVVWNEAMKKELISTQIVHGELAGSWDPRCVWGGHGGRIYTTALGCMCLEVYYRYLPIYQQQSLTAP
ncbi:MAG: prenyltransferase/squalene oxidase repeat-containing protein [Planctomycetota bacterium]